MKIIVRSGLPGKIRVETEDGEGVDLDNALTAYQVLHEGMPWFQAKLDAASPPAKKSIAPKADA